MSNRPLAIFDIDGVLADVRHRLHHIEGPGKKNWRRFFADAIHDTAHAEGLKLYAELSQTHDIVFLTGRPEECREQTQAWLDAHGLVGPLYMRPLRNYRPASEAKTDQLDVLAVGRIVDIIIDDDPRVLDAHAAKGHKTFLATWAPHRETLRRAQEEEGRT